MDYYLQKEGTLVSQVTNAVAAAERVEDFRSDTIPSAALTSAIPDTSSPSLPRTATDLTLIPIN